MIAADFSSALSECEQMLALLSRCDKSRCAGGVLRDAQEIRRLLSLYSFRTPHRAERLCAELTSRYRGDILALYGNSVLSRRQSDSAYLRLEQLLSLLVRVAALRLAHEGALSLSHAQLTQSDGMLLALLEKEMQQKTQQSAGG